MVISIVEYEKFLNEYDETMIVINTPEK